MELSDAVRAFLDEVRFGVFATIGADGMPHQTTMWFERQGDTILLNTRRGRVKDHNLRRDPRASLCVADGYRYVTLSGTCALQDADQEAAQEDIRRLAIRYDGPERGEQQAAEFRTQQRESIYLRIERVDAHDI